MGIGGIGVPSLIIILVIVLLLFGTKKLRNLGGDLGGAIKGFKKAIAEDEKKDDESEGRDDAKVNTTEPEKKHEPESK